MPHNRPRTLQTERLLGTSRRDSRASGYVSVATPDLDRNSLPGFIGIKIPFTLIAGAYTLQFRTPTDILVAEVKFQIRNMMFDDRPQKP